MPRRAALSILAGRTEERIADQSKSAEIQRQRGIDPFAFLLAFSTLKSFESRHACAARRKAEAWGRRNQKATNANSRLGLHRILGGCRIRHRLARWAAFRTSISLWREVAQPVSAIHTDVVTDFPQGCT